MSGGVAPISSPQSNQMQCNAVRGVNPGVGFGLHVEASHTSRQAIPVHRSTSSAQRTLQVCGLRLSTSARRERAILRGSRTLHFLGDESHQSRRGHFRWKSRVTGRRAGGLPDAGARSQQQPQLSPLLRDRRAAAQAFHSSANTQSSGHSLFYAIDSPDPSARAVRPVDFPGGNSSATPPPPAPTRGQLNHRNS